MWTPLRKEIEQIRKQFNIPASEFTPLNQHTNWQEVEENIYSTFCQLDHPTARPLWLWERFKSDTYGLSLQVKPYLLLDKLVSATEPVYFMVNETVNGGDKFWFYEGYVKPIQTIIGESCQIDELYLISMKYKWLLCINHHDTLIGTGEGIVSQQKALEERK